MWTISLILSAAMAGLAVAVSLICCAAQNRQTQENNHHGVHVMYILIAGIAAAAVLMFLPIHLVQVSRTVGGCLQALALSLFNTVQLFAAGAEFSIVDEGTACLSRSLAYWHCVWASVLYIVAPCFTLGAVLLLLKNVFAQMRYSMLGRHRDTYVFTDLNERSLTLAEDIRRHHKRHTIVFTNVPQGQDEQGYEWTERAKALHAICFKKDVLAVDFSRHAAEKALYFFAIQENERDNLDQASLLVERYKQRPNTRLFVFSTSIESELMMGAMDKGVMHVHRVNEIRSLIDLLLYDEGHEVFETARPNENGEKTIAAMIVGMGGYGTEMVKALAWFGQMDGYRLEIHAFDRDPLAEDRFTVKAPELMSPSYNGVVVEGEAAYTIRIHAGVDVESVAFMQAVGQLSHTTYVLVSLGSDERNIQTAIDLRMLFERAGAHPVIYAIVQNTNRKDALKGICNYRSQPYDIRMIGDLESMFSEKVILHSALEDAALARHLKWGAEDEFWAYEYNYRSSVASAIHARARVACGIPGADKVEKELTEQEALRIEMIEHRRWNAYMRAQGYVYSGSTDKASRNDLAKMHHDLVDYAALTEEEKRKDRVTEGSPT